MQQVTRPSPLEKLYQWERQKPNQVFLRQPIQGQNKDWTWGDAAQEIRRMATALRDLGVNPGDRIAILSKNCAHWFMADLAIMMVRAVSVPLYPTQQAESIEYVLQHANCRWIFVGKLDEPAQLAKGIPNTIPRIAFPYPQAMQAEWQWNDLIAKSSALKGEIKPDLDELATLIYTSGTTGFPKGVMHSYRTIAEAALGYQETFQFSDKDRLFSYLPLSHVAERILIEMNSLYAGSMVSFAESLETFAQNLRDASPTVFFSVPRLWKKFQQGILAKLPQQKLDFLLKIPVINQLIARKIRLGLGLNKARCIGSGAAPISPSLQHWFQKLGINILEGYGLTENFGYSTANTPERNRLGTVGFPQPATDIRLNEQGEILIRNPATMLGYYKDPEATAQAIQNGYLHTGDMGIKDEDGFIKITGRIKEIFKTDKGKYISPAPLEHKMLADNPYIEQLCIAGHALPGPVALCVLSELGKQAEPAVLMHAFRDSLQRINARVDKHEQIDRCILVKEDWTVDAGLMTPTLKVKRKAVEHRYQHTIGLAFARKDAIIFEDQLH